MGGGDIAQCPAAGDVRAVGIGLAGHLGLLADAPHPGRRHAVRGIPLASVEFDDKPPVQIRPVGGVCLLRVVGVHRMGIVRGYQEAVRYQAQDAASVEPHALPDPPQRILQESGIRSLLGTAPHLLVVEYGADIYVVHRHAPRKPLGGGVHALQIVQPGGEHELPSLPEYPAPVPDIEEQVVAQDVLLLHAHGLCHAPQQRAVLFPAAALPVEGEHIRLGVIFYPFVHLAVHMDGHIGDYAQILLDVHQPGLHPRLSPHDHPPRHRQGPVQPCGQNHAAVLFRVQLQIGGLHGHLRGLLYLERRGIPMGRRDVEALRRVRLGHAERDQGGIVPGHIISLPGFRLPLLRLLQLPEAQSGEHFLQVRHCLESGRALLDELQQFLRALLIFLHHILTRSLRLSVYDIPCHLPGLLRAAEDACDGQGEIHGRAHAP